jgi:protein required for attachment to host cells
MHHKLAHGAWVFVGDGQKALFLINEGDEKFPNLRRLAVERTAATLQGAPIPAPTAVAAKT